LYGVIDPLREPLSLRFEHRHIHGLRVVRASIRESIGHPWSAEIEAVQPASDAAIDPEAMLGADACLGLQRSERIRRDWDGVVMACSRMPAGSAWRRWRLTLTHPNAQRGLNRNSRLVRDRDAAGLAADLLADRRHGVRRDLRQPPASREQLSQWRESDLAWAQRLLEHDGISLICDGRGSLLTDHHDGFPRLDLELPFIVPADGALASIDPTRRPAIRAWNRSVRAVAGRAVVRDWHWRSPQEAIVRSAELSRAGGEVRDDGGHHRDGGEAARLAGIRAEELRCANAIWSGDADHPSLTAGHVVRIVAPDEPDADGSWLLTTLQHELHQEIETGGSGGSGNIYHCSFTAWPADRTWRPQRLTPIPRVPGLIHAVVDGPRGAIHADPDDDGCYRVRPVYDADGSETMAVRLATPYAGEDHGLHLPLHRGTEVLIAHIDGDPDRPVIAAAVPNPTHPSLVTADNRSQCVLQSASGNRLMLDDAVGREVWETVAKRDRRARIGGDDDSQVRGNSTTVIAGSQTTAVQGDNAVTVGRASAETVAAAKALTVGGAMQVSVGGALNTTVGGVMAEQVGAAQLSAVVGSRTATIGGDCDVTVGGDQQETTTGKRQVRAKRMRIAVQDEFAITCGKASIVMKSNGDIIIKGGAITIDGSGKVVVKGSKLAGN